MTAPWIEVEENEETDVPVDPGHTGNTWQALFACQVLVPSHQDWLKLKWGFNASALFDEMLERQKLFLESQYLIRNDLGIEPPEHRTLALRFLSRPGDPFLVAVMGKIKGCTRQEALDRALAFYNEMRSIFPYDYTLLPARGRDEFLHLCGFEILAEKSQRFSVVQIKRAEIPVSPERNSTYLQGLWQSGSRAHEQIWRSLANASYPVLLNITLRSTILYEKERGRLLQSADEVSAMGQHLVNSSTLAVLQERYKEYVERRMSPWGKFFYLQIHLASAHVPGESLPRIIGTALTARANGHLLPGYQVTVPASEEVPTWQKRIRNLDLIFSGSYLPVPRLSEVADLEEVFAAVRLPYSPPEDGFRDVRFGTAGSE